MKSVSAKVSPTIVGAAGEHLVMGELLRRGHIAALAPQGAPNMDILIADKQGDMLFSIQVKTRTQIGGDGGWHMGIKHEGITGERLFYVFVDLGKPKGDMPEYYILPAKIVAEVVRETHMAWKRTKGRGGRKRSQTSTMRRIKPDNSDKYSAEESRYPLGWMDKYRNAWHLFDTT